MTDARLLLRWLLVLRVITGGIFLYIGMNHLLSGWATATVFGPAIGRFAGNNPLSWYTSVMVPLVQSQPGLFGSLFTYGMVLTGLGLMLGVLTVPALIAGLWLNVHNFLMGFGAGGVHHGLNVLMAGVQVGLLQTGAWRSYTMDQVLLVWWRSQRGSAPPAAAVRE